MLKKLLSLLITISCLSAKAQKPLHITVDATYFDPASTTFYKPLNSGNALVYYIDIDFDDNTMEYTVKPLERKTVNLEAHLKMQGKSLSYLVPMANIKKGSTGYDKKLETLASRSLPKTTQTSNYYTGFQVVNPYYFAVVHHRGSKDKESNEYSYHLDVTYTRFATIVVNNCFTIYTNDNQCHIANYNGESYLYISEEPQTLHGTFPSKEFTTLLRKTYPVGENVTHNGKMGVMGYKSNKILIPTKYDSIFNDGNTLIIAYKKEKPHLFYRTGEEVKIKKLRAVYRGNDLSVLTGNKVSWLSPEGKLTDSVPLRLVCGGSSFEMEHIYKKDNSYILSKYLMEADSLFTKEWVLGSDTTFSNVSLIMGEARINFNTRYILAETPDGKKGIISPAENGYTITINPDYQEITGYFNNLLRIDTKNGLCGYYPLNKEAKYTRLARFEKGFARFTLPNGKQGWLAMDGTEYLDE
ncbi:hypothetical protein AM493_02050 [Flavobacterium akiainvivens]|uniref:WG repeat-containing protein n=1 Tax=Flavobacterium akiainvivens TaxID=1202724 RepID=A0A0M8MB29_9FLAO|nr:hypothetical protein [Flavobacterium akiainvivens]KOS04954.1 hypothetical protein AM493_02050 [Flavobacterium akiainvivens]SFQ41548.1 hypothetical protein SAMN05444144_104110 [Flavobacterium akiainvivens]